MKITDRVPEDSRLTWNRRGGLVLAVLLTRIGREMTLDRLMKLIGLTTEDVCKQVVRFTKSGVVSRRTDLGACPAKDYFSLPESSVVRARAQLQLADDPYLRELAEERGLDVDIAFGNFQERQPYAVALGKALRDVRDDLGWSLKDTAKAVPVSMSTVSNYENGVTLPTLITASSPRSSSAPGNRHAGKLAMASLEPGRMSTGRRPVLGGLGSIRVSGRHRGTGAPRRAPCHARSASG